MQGFPPHPDTRVTLANWQDPPFNRWSFSHLRELVPTQPIRNHALGHIPVESPEDQLDHTMIGRLDGDQTTFAQLLEDTYTDAVVVLHGDQIRYERYFGEAQPHRTHLLMSVTKSLISCVAGILVERGLLSPEDQLTRFVPELNDSGYAGATVRNVLDMRSGVKFSEEYTDPDAEVRVMEQAFGWRPASHSEVPRSIYEFTATLSREREHGGVFDYRSCETLVLGWVLERAAQARMADLLSSLLWTPMAAQYPAEITCDSVGTAIHDGGICATARDMARFGELLLHRGHLDGVDIVPPQWIRSSWRVDPDIRDAFARSSSGPYLPGGWYRNQFWFIPRRHGDVLLCLGIYGQMIYVNPGTKTVAAKLSTWPDAQNPVFLSETIGAFDTIGALLAGLPTDTDSTHEGPPGIASGRSR